MRPAAIAFALLFLPTAARAESWDVVCPTEARGSVELQRNDGTWVATPQSSAVTGRAIESIGGQPALVCLYSLFGSDYRVWRRPPPEVPNCTVQDWGFLCSS